MPKTIELISMANANIEVMEHWFWNRYDNFKDTDTNNKITGFEVYLNKHREINEVIYLIR